MSQKPCRDRYVRSFFLGLSGTRHVVIKSAGTKIDLRPAERKDRFLASARVEPQKDKQRKMQPSICRTAVPNDPPLLSRANIAALSEGKARAAGNEPGGFISGWPPFPWGRRVGQMNGDGTR